MYTLGLNILILLMAPAAGECKEIDMSSGKVGLPSNYSLKHIIKLCAYLKLLEVLAVHEVTQSHTPVNTLATVSSCIRKARYWSCGLRQKYSSRLPLGQTREMSDN